MGLANFAYEVLEQCEICRAFNKAPHIPIAGASTVSAFKEKFQADLLPLDDAGALRAMEVCSKFSFSISARPETLKKYGMPSAARRFLFWAGGGAYKCMREVNGEMTLGWIFARRVV